MENINLTENAKTVLNKRYLKRDDHGTPTETPEDLFMRVARSIAMADAEFNNDPAHLEYVTSKFYNLMASLRFMPNSPTLMNAGRELGQLSACFVLPIEDSLDAIFEGVKNTAMIHKSGGGTGFSFSRLRPKNDIVKTTMGVSSGPVSFMDVFNSATEAVKQGGTRRGANMGVLRVDHPDIEEFINCKVDPARLTNFNISVALTDKFMDAVMNDEEYELVHPRTKEAVRTLPAKKIFDTIVDNAWKNGEPGIIFIDRVNEDNPTPLVDEIESTNPCGEVPLLPYEACNLGSINLGKMVKEEEDGTMTINWERLGDTVKDAVHFLDNVIMVNHYPLPQITEMVNANRKIGLGVMGWADMLMKLDLPYNSEEGTALAAQVMEFIDFVSKEESIALAEVRGAFPNFKGSLYDSPDYLYTKYQGKSSGMIKDEYWQELDQKIQKHGIRNATTTCIAPTGTISMIAGASGGVEPLFSISFIRNVMDNTEMVEVNPIFDRISKERGFYSDELMKRIAKEGSLVGFEEIPEDVKKVFVTAHDVEPYWHVKMQAAFQLHTDNAVSKTINFHHDAKRNDIAEGYKLAYESNLKGITVYRDGSRSFQPMNLDNKQAEAQDAPSTCGKVEPRKRPTLTKGLTDKINTGCGALFVTINEDEHGYCEVFARMGKSGGCATSQAEAVGRLISIALRANVPIEHVIDQLKGIRCPSPTFGPDGVTLSCSDAISKVLKRNTEMNEENGNASSAVTETDSAKSINSKADLGLCPECPDCSCMLEFAEGCVVCPNCGYSKCS